MKVYKVPPGSTCDECGALVIVKRIIEADPVPIAGGTWTPPDRLGANEPCGHDAGATWTNPTSDGGLGWGGVAL